jgi:oxygen-independent coproporphyrinogen-3 oxidase
VTSVEQLEALREVGFNRLSMGVQDFTPEVQKAIHRHQSEEQTAALIAAARRLGFVSVNVDLVYGLPHQTVAGFGRSIDAVLGMGVDRVACYSYAHVPWLKKHQRAIPEAALPRGPAKFELFALAWDKFTGAGMVPVGMDHFARPQDEMARALGAGTLHRNFMGYTTKASDDMIAFGVTAIADVAGAFVQGERELPRWQAAVAAGRLPVHKGWRRSADDDARRQVILDLMCRFRVRYADHEPRLGEKFATRFAAELERLADLERDGLVERRADELAVTEVGRVFIRNVCMAFDAWLPRQAAEQRPVFSRTV